MKQIKKLKFWLVPNHNGQRNRMDAYVWYLDGSSEKLTYMSREKAQELLEAVPIDYWMGEN